MDIENNKLKNEIDILKIENTFYKNENENLNYEVNRLKIIVEQIFKIRTDTNFLNNKKNNINLDF